jgi:protein tyrosine phosphatase (PTP) superfamily phosphohydrolase (DUF442 family)
VVRWGWHRCLVNRPKEETAEGPQLPAIEAEQQRPAIEAQVLPAIEAQLRPAIEAQLVDLVQTPSVQEESFQNIMMRVLQNGRANPFL